MYKIYIQPLTWKDHKEVVLRISSIDLVPSDFGGLRQRRENECTEYIINSPEAGRLATSSYLLSTWIPNHYARSLGPLSCRLYILGIP